MDEGVIILLVIRDFVPMRVAEGISGGIISEYYGQFS
jgi:hypothetical protein